MTGRLNWQYRMVAISIGMKEYLYIIIYSYLITDLLPSVNVFLFHLARFTSLLTVARDSSTEN